jgi:hypothetical protein
MRRDSTSARRSAISFAVDQSGLGVVHHGVMAWIKCPQCGELRKFENVLAGDEWLTPPCWNCGHKIPPRPAVEDAHD